MKVAGGNPQPTPLMTALPLFPFQVWPLRSTCNARISVFLSSHHIFSSLLHHAYFVLWYCFCCAGDAHIAALSQVFTHPRKTSGLKKLELRYVNVIVIIFL